MIKIIKIKSENSKKILVSIILAILFIFLFISSRSFSPSSFAFLTECNDGKDNDNDGWVDYPKDPGCTSSEDTSEIAIIIYTVCKDGKDNDLDGLIDYPNDLGCTSSEDDFETNNIACNDGMDNDNDGLIDYPNDPTCTSYNEISEGTYSRKNGPDLIVSRMNAYRLSTSTGFTWGKYYGITIWFKNIGTAPVSHPFNVIVNAPKSTTGMYYTYYQERLNQKFIPRFWGMWGRGEVIKPGEEITTSIYWVPLYEGQIYEISAIVDSKSEISEIDESNNKLAKRFAIEMQYGGVENVKEI